MKNILKMTKIIVIGAGVSGIASATKLLENGFNNIIVLEAEKRIGGRIHSIPFASNVVDLGAQWCHGEKDNVVFELANKYQLFSSATTKYDNFLCIKSNGKVLEREIGDRLTELAIGIVECYKDELETYQGSLGSFIVEKYEKLIESPEYKDIDKNTAFQYLDFFHRYENSIEASDTWYDTSATGYLHYWDCEGDRLLNWKDRGYRTILDILMKKYPDPSKTLNLEDKITFDKKVSNIEWNRSDGLVNVKCVDGSSYLTNHVISTVSLGVLKESYLSLFSPALPKLKVNAIQGLAIGTVDKIFIEFDQPFWEPDWQGFSLLWEKTDLDEITKMENLCWIRDVFGFYVVDFQPNILCGWISGHAARQMELSSDDNVRKGVMYLLNKFLKKLYSEIPEPKRIERSKWYSNPNFRGSYSFRSIATDLLKTSAADLAKPLVNNTGVPVLQFAGEATHDHYYSTVHGALETGWREANRIIDFYKSMPNQMPTEIQLNHPEIVQEVDVIILGGGLAGLGAAYHLKKSSAQTFVILEANNIPGGRILAGNLHNSNMIETEKDSENVINAGAQWLHGRENPLFEIANKHGLLSDELSEEGLGVYLRNDGYRFNEFLVNKVDFIVGQILEKCESFAQNPNTQESIPKSIGSYFITEFDKRLSEFKSDHEKVLAKQLLDWHIRFQIIDNSCLSIDDVSAKSWGTYSFNGESCQAHINFKKSFYDIIEVLVEEIGKNKIKCNNTVEKICWGLLFNENNADDGKPSNMPKNLILTKNGNVFVAKHVICTFSLGVLKNKMNNMFQPQLPNTHQMAINSMGFAAIDKIFLQFDTAWWGNEKGFQLIFEDSHYENADWTRMISGFDILHPGPPNTLLCWIGGMGAIEMEKQKDEEIIDKILQLLQKFTKSHISKPINYYVTRWHTNPLVCGAYSYCSTKCDDDNILPKNLSIPVFYKNLNIKNCPINVNNVDEHTNDSPLLLFAGEACHDKYYSTAHGAFISGIEQATKVIEYIQNAK